MSPRISGVISRGAGGGVLSVAVAGAVVLESASKDFAVDGADGSGCVTASGEAQNSATASVEKLIARIAGLPWLYWITTAAGWESVEALCMACHTYGMSVRTTVDIPEDLYAELKKQSAEQETSIRSLVVSALESKYRVRRTSRVKLPLVPDKGKPGPVKTGRENPYDLIFT